MTSPSLRIFGPFGNLREALYLERPNRFVVRVDLDGRIVEAHCPNPGRMVEILVPGTPLLLENKPMPPDHRGKGERGLEYTLIAARHRGFIVPLVSSRANDLAEKIVVPALFPDAVEVRREVAAGGSRLDFRLDFGNRASGPNRAGGLFLEVKGCTLIEEGTAMFPDAPTLRGLKHLEDLEAMADQGSAAGILFILMRPDVRRFVPNLHTDPAFSAKLIGLKGRIWMRAVSMNIGEDGLATLADPDIPLDLEAASGAREDGGVYLLVVEVKRGGRLAVGSLGEILIDPGWYVYVGSGKRNLSARIARHHRRRKKMHWHIDYLLNRVDAGDITSLPVRSRYDLECRLARDVGELATGSCAGFGSSDCSCRSHLFRFGSNPLQDRCFLDRFLHYRHTLALTRSS